MVIMEGSKVRMGVWKKKMVCPAFMAFPAFQTIEWERHLLLDSILALICGFGLQSIGT